jgi:hypothetical protein
MLPIEDREPKWQIKEGKLGINQNHNDASVDELEDEGVRYHKNFLV